MNTSKKCLVTFGLLASVTTYTLASPQINPQAPLVSSMINLNTVLQDQLQDHTIEVENIEANEVLQSGKNYFTLLGFPSRFSYTYLFNGTDYIWGNQYRPAYFRLKPMLKMCRLRFSNTYTDNAAIFFDPTTIKKCENTLNECIVNMYSQVNKVPINRSGFKEIQKINVSFRDIGTASNCENANGEWHNLPDKLSTEIIASFDQNINPVFVANNRNNLILVAPSEKMSNQLINDKQSQLDFGIGYINTGGHSQFTLHKISHVDEKICPNKFYSVGSGMNNRLYFTPVSVTFINPYNTTAQYRMYHPGDGLAKVSPEDIKGEVAANTSKTVTMCMKLYSQSTKSHQTRHDEKIENTGVEFTTEGKTAKFKISNECGEQPTRCKNYQVTRQENNGIFSYQGFGDALFTTFSNKAPQKSAAKEIYAINLNWSMINLDRSTQFESHLYKYMRNGTISPFSGCNSSKVVGGDSCKMEYYVKDNKMGDFPVFLSLEYTTQDGKLQKQYFPFILRYGIAYSPDVIYGLYGDNDAFLTPGKNELALELASSFKNNKDKYSYILGSDYYNIYTGEHGNYNPQLYCNSNTDNCFVNTNMHGFGPIYFHDFSLNTGYLWSFKAKYKDPVFGEKTHEDKIVTAGNYWANNNIGNWLPGTRWLERDPTTVKIITTFTNISGMFAPEVVLFVAPVINQKVGSYKAVYRQNNNREFNISSLFMVAYSIATWHKSMIEKPIAFKFQVLINGQILDSHEVICSNWSDKNHCKIITGNKEFAYNGINYKANATFNTGNGYNAVLDFKLTQLNDSDTVGKILGRAAHGMVDAGDHSKISFGQTYFKYVPYEDSTFKDGGPNVIANLSTAIVEGYNKAKADYIARGYPNKHVCKLYNGIISCNFEWDMQVFTTPKMAPMACVIGYARNKNITLESLKAIDSISCDIRHPNEYAVRNYCKNCNGFIMGVTIP